MIMDRWRCFWHGSFPALADARDENITLAQEVETISAALSECMHDLEVAIRERDQAVRDLQDVLSLRSGNTEAAWKGWQA